MEKFFAGITGFFATAVRVFDLRTTAKELFAACSEIFRDRTLPDPALEEPGFHEALRTRIVARLILALAFSEVIGTYIVSPVATMFGQYAPGGSPMIGAGCGIAGDYFGAVTSYWLGWYLLNRAYYREGGWLQLSRFVKDVLPLHALAIGVALWLYVAEFVVAWVCFSGLAIGSKVIAWNTPAIVYFGITNGLMEALFLGGAGLGLPYIAEIIAPRYTAYLSRKV